MLPCMQSKGLEWDTVFIVKVCDFCFKGSFCMQEINNFLALFVGVANVKANDSEIPLLHEAMGSISEGSVSLEVRI